MTDDEAVDREPVVDWRSRTSTAGLVVGLGLLGLEKALYDEKQKDQTEEVQDEPLEGWPRLEFGNGDVEPLGPDEDGYWPSQ